MLRLLKARLLEDYSPCHLNRVIFVLKVVHFHLSQVCNNLAELKLVQINTPDPFNHSTLTLFPALLVYRVKLVDVIHHCLTLFMAAGPL